MFSRTRFPWPFLVAGLCGETGRPLATRAGSVAYHSFPADNNLTRDIRAGRCANNAFTTKISFQCQLEECTKAVSLGGNRFGGKWGTPDVFGIFRSRESDIVKFPIEVISAEIKTNTAELITAYGQACAYKLFSHRSYLVIPQESSPEDIDRLDSLCIISGIGLILFDAARPHGPNFQIRVRAVKHEPDTFYVNQNIKQVADSLGL
mgnify:CR=1 FL=1